VLSVCARTGAAQFREEKDHKLQVRAFARLLRSPTFAKYEWAQSVRLLLVGGCRGPADQQVGSSSSSPRRAAERLRALMSSPPSLQLLDEVAGLARELGVEDRVSFRKNVGWDELRQLLGRSAVGLHTMWCEHFGIGVVQMMVRLPPPPIPLPLSPYLPLTSRGRPRVW
jgi:alpha-1,2-mannosyltransferase